MELYAAPSLRLGLGRSDARQLLFPEQYSDGALVFLVSAVSGLAGLRFAPGGSASVCVCVPGAPDDCRGRGVDPG